MFFINILMKFQVLFPYPGVQPNNFLDLELQPYRCASSGKWVGDMSLRSSSNAISIAIIVWNGKYWEISSGHCDILCSVDLLFYDNFLWGWKFVIKCKLQITDEQKDFIHHKIAAIAGEGSKH